MTKEQWLEERKKGIGGSDAATIVNKNPYKNIVQLWEEKTGRRNAEDISDKPYVKYGTEMEDILRESFKIKNPDFELKHEEYSIIRHPEYQFLFASLDGILIDKKTGELGILEIKTSNIHRSSSKEKWKDGIPDNYYCQVLHYMNVTGATFARLFAELTYANDYQVTKTYEIDANDEKTKASMKKLLEEEIKFWKKYVETGIRPPLPLPEIEI